MRADISKVYQPAEDTWLLMEAVKAELRPGDRILEIGTGSGAIAGDLARVADVVATDINPHAVAIARSQGVPVIRTDLFVGIRGPFDLVFFNPPYLPTRPEERIDDWLELALDGGETGRAVIARFVAGVGRVLAPDGRVLLLISSLTGLTGVCRILREEGFDSKVVRREPVFGGEELVVLRLTRATNEKRKIPVYTPGHMPPEDGCLNQSQLEPE